MNRKAIVSALIVILLVLVAALAARPLLRRSLAQRYGLSAETSAGAGHYLVQVNPTDCTVLAPKPGPIGRVRLTRIQRQQAVSPESDMPPTDDLVGRCVLVYGLLDSGWLYEARIVASLTPLEAGLARYAFGQ